jgi:hypothetical protein
MRELNIDDYWMTNAEDHLGMRFTAAQGDDNRANKIALQGYIEALHSLGLEYSIDHHGTARIWDPVKGDSCEE